MTIYTDPKLLETAQIYGQAFYQSGFFGLSSAEQGTVFAIEMIASNKTPFAMMQTYHVVSGTKVTKSASAMLAEFNERGGRHRVLQYNPDGVSIEFEYNGATVPVSISWEQAQQEKWPFKKDGKTLIMNWSTPLQRAAMLFARVTTRGIRACCPEVNAGTYSPEELGAETTTANAMTIEKAQSILPESRIRATVSRDPAIQGQLDQINNLMQQISSWESDIELKVGDVIKGMGKDNLAQLSVAEADQLKASLDRKQTSHVMENGIENKEYVFGGEEG